MRGCESVRRVKTYKSVGQRFVGLPQGNRFCFSSLTWFRLKYIDKPLDGRQEMYVFPDDEPDGQRQFRRPRSAAAVIISGGFSFGFCLQKLVLDLKFGFDDFPHREREPQKEDVGER